MHSFIKHVSAYQVRGIGLVDEDKKMKNSEAYNHFTVQWEGERDKIPEYAQSTVDVHRGVHLLQNEVFRKYFLKGWLLSHILKKKLELAMGKGGVGWPF